jgi:3-deoxy-manno-octulosonate cytidylyltransferase (CMP-KDO synthetase)
MTAVGIIPARYHSLRFPGKALAQIAGVSLIERVWRGARAAKSLRDVIIAVDDERIADVCKEFGASIVFTSTEHPTGSDRVAEVARALSDDIVVNIQGDEALVDGFVVDAVVDALLEEPAAEMATLVHEAEENALDDPNRVKAVLDRRGFALYFSRSAIPAHRAPGFRPPVWQHVGLYAYRRPFLLQFVELARTPAEQAEELEQLRALEHGFRIRAAVIEGWRSIPVDVPADIARVEAQLALGTSPRGTG